MNRNKNILLWLFLVVCTATSFTQFNNYAFKQEVKGITDKWHKIKLPEHLFEHAQQNLADVRVMGVTPDGDTVQAPYILKLCKNEIKKNQINLYRINSSFNRKGHYITFENPQKASINSMHLNLGQNNFDWHITLEGSQDQNEWFTILSNYRILSIQNDQTNFEYTKLLFPTANYRFFRIQIKSDEKPTLHSAVIEQIDTTSGNYRTYCIEDFEQTEIENKNQTQIDIKLDHPIRVNSMKLVVRNKIDYYRPVSISYIFDSVKTDKGMKYLYRNLTHGTLNSLNMEALTFENTTIEEARVIIKNHDNEPLEIDSIIFTGVEHELIARFESTGEYHLVYGNQKAIKPTYDITNFKSQLPDKIKQLELLSPEKMTKADKENQTSIFENKLWLWGIMIIVIVLLGWFSLKMLKENSRKSDI